MADAGDRKMKPKERRVLRQQRAAEAAAASGAAAPAPTTQEPADHFTIEFWEDDNGNKPVLDWIKDDLTPTQRAALGKAMQRILQTRGIDVCDDHWGKPVAKGIAEFRLRMKGSGVINSGWAEEGDVNVSAVIFLRVFFHAHGDKLLLLLEGYDKGADTSDKRQQAMIESAKSRLKRWKERQAAAAKAVRRDGPAEKS